MAFFEEWDDDDRMEALFSSSAIFDAKMLHAWKPAVLWTLRGRATDNSKNSALTPSLLIFPESLARRFVRKGVEPVPVVLNHVLSHMIQDKDLIHLEEFQAMCEQVSLPRWLFRTAVVTPARWGLHSLHSLWNDESSTSSAARRIPPGPYLPMEVLKTIAHAIVDFVMSELEPTERTFCLSQNDHATCGPRLSCSFHALCLRVGASISDEMAIPSILKDLAPTEFAWIAKYLAWSKQAVIRGDLLKIHRGQSPALVTAGDESLLVLQHMIATLEVSMAKLQAKMDETKAKAVARKRANNLTDALVYLRHSKTLGDSLAQRQAGLLNLLQTEHQLRDMHVQALVVDGYKVASASMHHVRDSLGLTANAVDDAVAEWQIVADEASQIDVLLSSTAPGVAFDDDALAAELEALSNVAPETTASNVADSVAEEAIHLPKPAQSPVHDGGVHALATRVAQLNMSK
ncbi:hypothetical protein H310_00596 [Aphanomyces invadans]|uniref:Charged multivesicular body protein 7 n=1 Tax=Aphanomyces invadans TaxID=157072 RepID=A0A024UUP9_9STRA|nr:hypothetical protein H310_00596 [Aphanomyces invadans]ETW10246.1 hypothetical protein H310_00596 [Aphanomyces invadans]|eukprot:XP_008861657.1 hypothetical protein H310_00596 [Aphanomyces invadans]